MMTKISSILVCSFSAVCLLSGCAQEISLQVPEPVMVEKPAEMVQYELTLFCATKTHNISQQVTISDVTAIAHHRDGKLLIKQAVHQPQLEAALLKLAKHQDVTSQCMEYLSTNGLMTVATEGGLLARVYFNFDSEALTPESRYILEQVAENLARGHDNIQLVGHTDGLGTNKYNYDLGHRRAITTQTYLDKHGVDAAQLSRESQGERSPIANNDTADGRALNRRVDLHVSPQK